MENKHTNYHSVAAWTIFTNVYAVIYNITFITFMGKTMVVIYFCPCINSLHNHLNRP